MNAVGAMDIVHGTNSIKCSWSFSLAQDQRRHNTSQCPAPKCGTHFSGPIFHVSMFYQPTESSKNARHAAPFVVVYGIALGGMACTPKQYHKQRRRVQRAIPASIFGGISLGIHQTSTEPENVWHVWPAIGW